MQKGGLVLPPMGTYFAGCTKKQLVWSMNLKSAGREGMNAEVSLHNYVGLDICQCVSC